jgi:DMSO reductase family type II enzyme heme b subunit
VRPIAGDIPNDPAAPEWQAATEYFYPLAGQIMREPRNYSPSITGVWVRAIYNASDFALLVQWNDRQPNAGQDGLPADQALVQFPAAVPEGAERPYFVFGDAQLPVNLWAWTAGADAPSEQTGRGRDAVTDQGQQDLTASASYAAGRYSVVFRRALNTGDPEDIPLTPGIFLPIAFAASDGLAGEEPRAGSISSWYQIYLDEPTPVTNYIWIPAAVIVAAAIEALIVWAVRRNARRNA